MNSNSRAPVVPPKPAGPTDATTADGLHDIKPPVPIPSGWAWLAWTLGTALVLALALYALRRWWRHRAAARPAAPVRPPHLRARDRLQRALDALHDPKRFCIEVSDTLRIYLEERFQLHAPERTTEEFLDELQLSPLLSLGQKQALGAFLARCDLVKFARYEPGEPELRELWDAAVRLVDETAPVAPETPESAAA